MWKVLTVAAMGVALGGTDLAQGQGAATTEYCLWMQGRIHRMQTSLAGLTGFVNDRNLTVMQCQPDTDGGDSVDSWYNCMEEFGGLGMWRDGTTRIVYVVVPQSFLEDYAQNIGASRDDINRSLSAAEPVRNTIARGGVLDNLRAEIISWQNSYINECGSPQPNPESMDPNCLLGVCP